MKKTGISIVEDLDEVRNELERIVNSCDDFVLISSYSNAENCLKEIKELHPDIIIMDINLPRMDGIECIRQATTLAPATQFMVFTIFENSDKVFDAIEAGANGYLLKNTTPEKMVEALKELQDGGAPMSAHIARRVVASLQKKKDILNFEANVLTTREKEILDQLAKGFLYKEIAAKLGISTGTVRQHIHHIYEKLHVQNRTEAINKVYGKP
jgi:DNA-binding NarL/FixJ family response regulator